MTILDELVRLPLSRSIKRPYLPFSEKAIQLGKVVRPAVDLRAWRDYALITNGILSRRPLGAYARPLPLRATPSGSDRRLWSPSFKAAVSTSGLPISPIDIRQESDRQRWERISTPPRKIDWRPKFSEQIQNAPWWYGFANPSKVVICLKRKIRKEVMHALELTGKVGQNPPVFNAYSRVRC